jgi:hypothetical protein
MCGCTATNTINTPPDTALINIPLLEKWSGHILEATAALEFLFHKNFGIGTGYSYFDLEVERDREARVSDLTYNYGAVQIYGIWYF